MVWVKERAEGVGVQASGVKRGFCVCEDGMKKGGGAGEGWAVCWGYE